MIYREKMEAVLGSALCVCACKLMSGALLFPSVVTHTISAVSLCCCCLLVFTDLSVTLFLLCVWLLEFWMRPFSVSSSEVSLRVLIFLCDVYGTVLLLTPPLLFVEMLLEMLRAQDGPTKDRQEPGQPLSVIIGILGCFIVWVLSAIFCSHDGTLERMLMEECLNEGGCLVSCLPNDAVLSWVVPAVMLLLSSVGLIGMKASRGASQHMQMEDVVLGRWHMSASGSEESLRRAGCVYSEPGRLCPGSDVPQTHQTGSTGHDVLKQKPTICVFKRQDRERPGPRREAFTGLLCVVLLCAFPTLLSCNLLLIFNLENLVAFSLRLLSLSVNRVLDP